MGASILFGGEWGFAARADGRFFLGGKRRRDLRKAAADLKSLRRAGEGIGGAAEFMISSC